MATWVTLWCPSWYLVPLGVLPMAFLPCDFSGAEAPKPKDQAEAKASPQEPTVEAATTEGVRNVDVGGAFDRGARGKWVKTQLLKDVDHSH